jgi:hypothetical protein
MRPETEHAYNNANYIERLMIAFWVHDGWDRLWPWTMIPKWLAPRYDWRQLSNSGWDQGVAHGFLRSHWLRHNPRAGSVSRDEAAKTRL